MFNLYYVNYAKAFEIAMQIDNKVLEKQTVDNDISRTFSGEAGVTAPTSLWAKLLPALSADFKYSNSKADKTTDTLRVISTKSTILEPIVQKAVEIKKINNDRVGNLIKIKDVQLSIENYDDMMGSKMLLSGLLKEVPVDGLGNVDFSDMIDAVLKGASYIAIGEMPKRINSGKNDPNKLLIKIPLQMGNEMESQYAVQDLEIGPVTIIGIYRGVFKYTEIRGKIDVMKQFETSDDQDLDLETDESMNDENIKVMKDSEEAQVHYIDVIAIVQDLYY